MQVDRLLSQIDTDQLFVVADVGVLVCESGHTPNNVAAERQTGRLNDFRPIDFLEAFFRQCSKD